MDKRKYYKGLFIFAALYNTANSVMFIVITIAATDMFPTFGVMIPPSMIWLQLSLVLILIFGVGYVLVCRNLDENHGIVIIGSMAKSMFFVMAIIYFILGEIVILGGIDIVTVVLFVEFLLNYKNL